MSRSQPSQDAKGCLEKLFQYLELNVKNRVAAKIGANQQLDMGALSNINQQAAAAHRNKTKSVITSSRSRTLDITVDISPAQKSKLRETFIYYCAWGEKHNYLWMSRSQFIKFARDCRLTEVGGWDSVSLSILFEKVHRDSADAAPGIRFALVDWLLALLAIAMRIYVDMAPQEAFDKIVSERILGSSNPVPQASSDPLASVLLQPEVLDMLGAAAVPLEPVFKYYVNDQDFINLEKSGATVWDIQAARAHLPFASFITFAQDFQLLPALLTRPQLAKAFKLAKFSAHSSADSRDDMGRLSFQEFMDCIGRCALMAYHYQEAAVPPAVLAFSSSYHPQAKMIWQDDAQEHRESDADSIDFPDAISLLPSLKSIDITADLDDMLNDVDDAPDGWCLRTATAAASHARTAGVGGGPRTACTAAGRSLPLGVYSGHPIKKQDGAESMAIHDEITSLPVGDKPLHLQQFSNDWVGRPPSPTGPDPTPMKAGLASTATGRATQGDKRQDKFTAAMVNMIDARTTREQHLAALQLQCTAERREEARSHLKDAAARRERLQAAAGQAK